MCKRDFYSLPFPPLSLSAALLLLLLRLQLAGYYTLFSANANFSHKPYLLIVLSTTPSLNAALSVQTACATAPPLSHIIPQQQRKRNIIPQFVARNHPHHRPSHRVVVIAAPPCRTTFRVIKPITEHQYSVSTLSWSSAETESGNGSSYVGRPSSKFNIPIRTFLIMNMELLIRNVNRLLPCSSSAPLHPLLLSPVLKFSALPPTRTQRTTWLLHAHRASLPQLAYL